MSPKKNSAKTKAADVLIPEKLYFRIGGVSKLCRLPAYVLRFWETEFPQLKPVKGSTGQRMYRRKDVESVLGIKGLLYEQGFTIAGARQLMRNEIKDGKEQSPLPFPAARDCSRHTARLPPRPFQRPRRARRRSPTMCRIAEWTSGPRCARRRAVRRPPASRESRARPSPELAIVRS